MLKIPLMELTIAIYGRRAVRAYTEEPVSESEIAELIDAAVQAPSAMDQEPWAFAVIEGAERLRKLSARAKQVFAPHPVSDEGGAHLRLLMADPNFNLFHDAPVLIVVCATRDDRQAAEDCCLAAQNLMLMAHALKLGTCPIGFARPWLRLPETKRALGIDASYVPIFPVVVGHPAERPTAPGRRPPIVVTSRESA